ncbi:MAG: hypothetical protein K1Y02_15865 [Candidatus Hydrogenedentes bacterium]|nr:hypothetical protein [Candidatus Hydrogenedentota bacterium]
MPEDAIEVTYQFTCSESSDKCSTFTIALNPVTLESNHAPVQSPPDWAILEREQCRLCPLKAGEVEYCPAALSLVELVEKFGDLISYEEVEATVVTKERTTTLKTSVQRALSSLIGLRMATSGCPILMKFKPMARFHLPFATREETVYRAAGAYLLAQYFLKRRGGDADLDLNGLREIYRLVHEVNKCLANRIRHIPSGDAHLNAIVVLDLFTHALPYSIDENLAEMEHMFDSFFEPETTVL